MHDGRLASWNWRRSILRGHPAPRWVMHKTLADTLTRLGWFEDDEFIDVNLASEVPITGLEGDLQYALVAYRRRERSLRPAKLLEAAAQHDGRIKCEVPGCGFDFQAVYGEHGAGFAEVHHRRPPERGHIHRRDRAGAPRGGLCELPPDAAPESSVALDRGTRAAPHAGRLTPAGTRSEDRARVGVGGAACAQRSAGPSVRSRRRVTASAAAAPASTAFRQYHAAVTIPERSDQLAQRGAPARAEDPASIGRAIGAATSPRASAILWPKAASRGRRSAAAEAAAKALTPCSWSDCRRLLASPTLCARQVVLPANPRCGVVSPARVLPTPTCRMISRRPSRRPSRRRPAKARPRMVEQRFNS